MEWVVRKEPSPYAPYHFPSPTKEVFKKEEFEMKNFNLTWIPILLSLTSLQACKKADAQQGGRPPSVLNDEMRTREVSRILAIANQTSVASAPVAGTGGVILAAAPTAVDGGFAADAGFMPDMGTLDANAQDAAPIDGGFVAAFGGDAGFARPPYPCKLNIVAVDHHDAGVAATISCTGNVILHGRDQFGFQHTETITTDLAESADANITSITTGNVYEELLYFSTSTCSNFEAADYVQISCSDQVGIPWRGAATNLKNVCIYDVSATTSYCRATSGVNFDTDDYSISSGDAGFVPVSGDILTIRMRAPGF